MLPLHSLETSDGHDEEVPGEDERRDDSDKDNGVEDAHRAGIVRRVVAAADVGPLGTVLSREIIALVTAPIRQGLQRALCDQM